MFGEGNLVRVVQTRSRRLVRFCSLIPAQLWITVRPYQQDFTEDKSDDNTHMTDTANRSTLSCKEHKLELNKDGNISKRRSTK